MAIHEKSMNFNMLQQDTILRIIGFSGWGAYLPPIRDRVKKVSPSLLLIHLSCIQYQLGWFVKSFGSNLNIILFVVSSFKSVTDNVVCPKFFHTKIIWNTKGFEPSTSLAQKILAKKSDQVDFWTIVNFKSSRN